MGLLDDVKAAINPVTIDQFKSTIGKRGGVAKGNRYSVTIIPPNQTLFNLDPIDFVNAAIKKDAGRLVNDPRDINVLCSACTIPGMAIQTTEYNPYGAFQSKMATNQIFDDAEFTFILTNDYYVKKMFDKWQSIITSGAEAPFVAYKDDYVADIIVQQHDEKNTPIYGVKLIRAFPTTVGAIQLGNEQGEPATLTVTMAYERYDVDRVGGGIKSTINSVRSKLNLFKKLV